LNWKAVWVYLLLVIATMLAALSLVSAVKSAHAAWGDEPMPPIVVMIVCKTVPDPVSTDEITVWNDKVTGHRSRDWAIEDGKMHCRRSQVQLYNHGNPDATLTPDACVRSAISMAMKWEQEHFSSDWMVKWVACPTPGMDLRSGRIVQWIIPDCGHRETTVCENDIVI